MKRFLQAAVATLALPFILSGCTTEQTNTASVNTNTTNTTVTTNTNASQPVASPSPAATPKASEANAMPVTLPVLDAFFAEDAFAGELKTKLQLTDEQIAKLRAISRAETGKLKETNANGSTSIASSQADEQIKAVIGEEKTQKLLAWVRERWTKGDAAESGNDASSPAAEMTNANKPNGVPTDTRIVVNAPAYRMDVFENGKLVKSYKVGIGYPEFPLPTGLRTARTIIFNPTWTPPDEPWVAKEKVGQKVEAGSTQNPLGFLKIPIGAPSLIHGGKSPDRLGTFASHGCVGLTNALAQDFAKQLAHISGASVSDAAVNQYAQNRTETKEVRLKQPVPVELRYETIVVEDGRLHIYRDVYDKGTNTEENLRAVLDSYGVKLEQLSEQERTQVIEALQAMSRDAKGNPTSGANSNANANANSKASRKQSGQNVTRSIKGQKEIVIEIAALAGKGYPAPANTNQFAAPKSQSASSGNATPKRRTK